MQTLSDTELLLRFPSYQDGDSLPNLIKAVIRSSDPAMMELADVFIQLAAEGFIAKNSNLAACPQSPNNNSSFNLIEQVKTETFGDCWERWCEYKTPLVSPATSKIKLQGTYQRLIARFGSNRPINNESAIEFRDYLITNSNSQDSRNLLRELSNACDRQIEFRQCSLTHNPFRGMNLTIKKIAKNTLDNDLTADEYIENQIGKVCFTEEEQSSVLEYFAKNYPHYHDFVLARFLTGTRLGETVELRWRDVTSDFKKIVISRAWDNATSKVKPPKTGKKRVFLCGGLLVELLKELHRLSDKAEGGNNDLIFTGKRSNRVNIRIFNRMWSEAMNELVKSGKISKSLPPKNTRHTFINRARLAGYPATVIAMQVGHSVEVQGKSYVQQIATDIIDLGG